MCYLAIKELSNIAEDVIIVTSSLTKDMTGKDESFRAPAIRALCRITDSQMLAGIERYLKQAIVDKNPSVSSAALVSALVSRKYFSSLISLNNFARSILDYRTPSIVSTNRSFHLFFYLFLQTDHFIYSVLLLNYQCFWGTIKFSFQRILS